MDNPPEPHPIPEANLTISVDGPGLYCIEVDRKPSPFPVISVGVSGEGGHRTARLVGNQHTPYLLRLSGGSLRLAFAPAEIEGARLRLAGAVDVLRGLERPRVLRRLTLPVGKEAWIRPLLRGTPVGRELAKAMRLLTGWGFGIGSRNFQDTPDLFSDFAPPVGNAVAHKEAPAFVVVLHLFHPELWGEFSHILQRIKHSFHLIITTSLTDRNFHRSILGAFPRAEIVTLPNRGRDIGPFLQLLHDGKLDRFPLICKLHGKRTAPAGHRALLGQVWRRADLLDLVGSDERVESIVSRFHSNPAIGMIGSDRFRLPSDFMSKGAAWGRNQPLTLSLAGRLGQASDSFHLDFFAGTMFWVRREALRPLMALGLTLDDFPEEAGQRDGELHHAVERLFGALPGLSGLELDTVRPVLG